MATVPLIDPTELRLLQREFARKFVCAEDGVFGVTVEYRNDRPVLVAFVSPEATAELPARYGRHGFVVERRLAAGGRVAASSS